MKKYFLALFISLFLCFSGVSQTRGVKIGYIDMEYILEKVPNYAEAKSQLEEKAQKWKQEIEAKKVEINKIKEGLKTEKVLLTKELIAEREEEIAFLDNELLDYQQKRFGPNGDLILQKAVLVKPIQDQVFNAVQDIAEAKKYDFIFDKSSDLTMLFAGKRFDISDQVVRVLTRLEKREELTKKQLKDEQEKERKQDMIDENPTLSERQKILDERKEARQKLLDERKLAAEQKKKDFEDKRAQMLADREAKKNGTVSDKTTKGTDKPVDNKSTDVTPKSTDNSPKSNEADDKKEEQKLANEKKAADALAAKNKTIEDRKKALEDRKAKILADREAAKKAKEEERKKLLENKPK
jgi:Skp family chaperone for outer membrane proteins